MFNTDHETIEHMIEKIGPKNKEQLRKLWSHKML